MFVRKVRKERKTGRENIEIERTCMFSMYIICIYMLKKEHDMIGEKWYEEKKQKQKQI